MKTIYYYVHTYIYFLTFTCSYKNKLKHLCNIDILETHALHIDCKVSESNIFQFLQL